VLSSVTTYHNDIASSGQNLSEVVLTRTNVNPTTFGKLYSYSVDGQVYAQPLVQTQVNITTGPQAGLHDVLFVATQHDTLYALDASSGDPLLLWKRSFFDTALPGATSVTSVPNGDTGSGDITVEIGITGTPVIDPVSNTLYLVAKSKETVAGVDHYVQRLHAVNMSDGTDRVAPLVIGDTSSGNTNNTQIYVYGTGDGSVTDPYNGTGRSVVQFNALREHQRGALTIVNGVIYIPWASHGDNGPYHGWVVGVDPATLAVKGVFNTTPNGGLGGIWQAGGALSSDGTNLYFETGNGTFDGDNGNDTNVPRPGTVTGLDANGFPVKGNYGDSFVKVGLDPTTSPTNQNINGWGLKVVDYFTPFDQQYLNVRDLDVGSAADLVLPDSVGSASHPHLLIGSGKEGIIYLIDRENMGKYGSDDAVVQKVGGQLSGSLDTAAYYQNQIYYVEGYGGTAKTFSIASATMSNTPTSRSGDTFAFAGSTPSISANGAQEGIVWDVDRGTNQLRAYSSDSYATELYNSAMAAGNRDALGAAVKFQVPTVANGHVYVGSGTGSPNNFINVYGLIKPPDAAPAAPTNLKATAVSGSQIDLTWTSNDLSPNRADGYRIEQSPDGQTGWVQVATSGAMTTSYAVGGLTLSSVYYFRVRAFNVVGNSNYSNVTNATTTNQAASLDFSTGFGSLTNGILTFNGGSGVSGTRLQVTDTNGWEARSIFSTNAQDITQFDTRFQFQISPGGNTADGFTFVIQGMAPTAVGGLGGGLGYGPDTAGGPPGISKSLAIKFDIYDNAGEGVNSTGLYTNGGSPTTPADDLTPSGVDLHGGDVMEAMIHYDGSTLLVSIIDTITHATFTKSYNDVNIQGLVGGGSAYVGFTGGTGGLAALQEVLNWTFTPVIPAPPGIATNLKATVTGYTAGSTTTVPLGAKITWDAVSGANSYKLERKLGATGTYTQIATINQPLKQYQDDGLATQSTYVYRVRATNDKGDGAYSTETQVTTPALAATPTKGIATTVTDHSISLSWQDNASNEDGFQIFRSVNSGQFSLLASLPANTALAPSTVTYIDTTVQPGTKYDYHIQAFNLAGYSDFAGVTAYTAPAAVSTPSVILTGTTANSSVAVPPGATVSWNLVPGATSYKVERKLGTNGAYTQVGMTEAPSLSFHDDGLTPGSTYYYRVRASLANIDGSPSADASISTPDLPQAPVGVGAFSRSTTSLAVIWQDMSSNEDGFQIFRSLDGGPFSLVGSVQPSTATIPTVLGYLDSSLTPNSTYYYRVQAFNLSGFSNYAALRGTTMPTSPTQTQNVAAIATGYTSSSTTAIPIAAQISWDMVPSASSYQVERATFGSSNFVKVGQVAAPALSFKDQTIQMGNSYSYRVISLNSAGQGPASTAASVSIPTAPAAPTLGLASVVSPSTITVSWQDNASNEDGFQIFRSVNSQEFKLLASLPVNTDVSHSVVSYTDANLTPGTSYNYRIQAFNLAGVSGQTTASAVPGTAGPTGFTALANGQAVLLTWQAPAGPVSSYVLYRSTVSGGETSGSATPYATVITGTSYTDMNVSPGTTYFYKLAALNGATLSTLTPEVSAMVPAQAGTIRINFSNNQLHVPAGFVNDVGAVYGPKPNGLTFGWTKSNKANGRDRNSSRSPDEQHDSFTLMTSNKNMKPSWSIAVPDGIYQVHLVAGDPVLSRPKTFKVNLNGMTALKAKATRSTRWVGSTMTIMVTGGKLTMTNANGSNNNKIDYIEITRLLD